MDRDVSGLRLGFIGYGRHARANLYPSIALAGGRVVRVATRSQSGADDAAAAIGADRGYGDYRTMLAEGGLDAVFISVGPEDHVALTVDCLRAGVAVFVEKPLGMREAEARVVADASAASGRPAMVAFMKRFAPAYVCMRSVMADEARFGRVMSFDGRFAFAPWTDTLDDEGYLKLAAIHIVDLLRSLFGEVADVRGFRNSRGADIAMSVALQFESGVVGSMSFASAPSWGREHEELTVTGRTGFVKAENLQRVMYHFDRPLDGATPRWQALDEESVTVESVSSPISGGARDLYLRGFAGEVSHFLQCVVDGTEPLSSATDNVATMALCDRILSAVDF